VSFRAFWASKLTWKSLYFNKKISFARPLGGWAPWPPCLRQWLTLTYSGQPSVTVHGGVCSPMIIVIQQSRHQISAVLVNGSTAVRYNTSWMGTSYGVIMILVVNVNCSATVYIGSRFCFWRCLIVCTYVAYVRTKSQKNCRTKIDVSLPW